MTIIFFKSKFTSWGIDKEIKSVASEKNYKSQRQPGHDVTGS